MKGIHRIVLLGISLFISSSLFSQNNIDFIVNQFDKALEEAKNTDKDIFIDTYAPWCVPCKKMDKVFKNKKLASYYNEHFINVKIDVDRLDGKEIASKYDIVFLPTMLIVDKNGYVKLRIDGLKNAQELLNLGDFAVNPQNYKTATPAPSVPNTSSQKNTSQTITPEDIKEEKILYVLDGSSPDNPDFLYHEAFFRIQQMDGSSQKIAEKYLATQDDWSTEKNMKFIVSFVNSTDSEMFDYYVSNKAQFEKMMASSEYRKTLEILINRTLYRRIPRPDFKKVEYLYGLLFPRKSSKYAYQYMLQRLEEEEKYEAFVDLGEAYMESLIKQDAELLFKLGKYKCLNANEKELKECIYRVEQSVILTPEPSAEQYFTLAQLYSMSKKDKKALENAEQAMNIVQDDELLKSQISDLIEKLEQL